MTFAHMFWVKYTIGFEAYLGDGPRMPPKLLITNQIIKAVTLMGVIWLVALKFFKLDWSDVGLKKCKRIWIFLAIAIALLGAIASLLLVKAMVSFIPEWSGFTASRFAWGDGSFLQMFTLIFLTIFITPIAEEIFFRGFLFQWMATHHPVWIAVIASSIMFGASHIIPPQVIVATFMSILILFLYLRSGSIWPCIVCHTTNNCLGVVFGMLAVNGNLPVWLTPPV
jgi:membrane protease YdiL (CAAX protease family)